VAKVDARGEVVELGAGAEEIAKASTDYGNAHSLSHGTLKHVVREVFGFLPQKRTAGGAKWSATRTQPFGALPARESIDLVLTKVEPDAFEVEGKGTLEFVFEGLAADEMPEAMVRKQLKGTQLIASKVTIEQQTSRADGLVRASSHSATFEMQPDVPGIGPMHVDWTASLRRIEAPADASKAGKPRAAPDPAKAPAPATGK
jgi:hypothetical protein